jgi:hypothetical protein
MQTKEKYCPFLGINMKFMVAAKYKLGTLFPATYQAMKSIEPFWPKFY